MNRNESRYFNTAVKMDKALIALLEKKDFEYITVKEICKTAGVNRSTFYLHYDNTSDLLKEASRYVTDSFIQYFSVDKIGLEQGFCNFELEDLVFITPQYLTPYLTFVKENQRVYQTVIKRFEVMDFETVYNRLYTFIFDPVLERFNFPKNERNYILKFYLNGITAIIAVWLENNCRESIESISRIIMDCVVGKSLDRNEKNL